MIELDVSIVAGIIAAVVVVVQILIPNAIALFTIAIIDRDATAVTWTTAMRLAYSSNLPTLLRSDASNAKKVQRGVLALNWLAPLLLLCIATSAVVAPLGLTNAVYQTDKPIEKPAIHVVDESLLGRTTPPRQPTIFTRSCHYATGQVCPGSESIIDSVSNSTGIYSNLTYIDAHISPRTRDVYESGLQYFAPTVSGPFDIQSRFYAKQSEDYINHGEMQPVTRFRRIQTVIQPDSIQLFEGVVANTKTGGIGFRNHTIPADVPAGATWDEDLLFIDSETVCVDTNLTLVYTSPNATDLGMVGGFPPDAVPVNILDRGGFAMFKLKPDYPEVNMTDTQQDPHLWMRAYKAAFMANFYVAAARNITNPNTYDGPNLTGNITRHVFDFVKSEIGQEHLMDENFLLNYENLQMVSWDFLAPSGYTIEGNPWNITRDDFSSIGEVCAGSAGLDLANITNVAVSCGLIATPARLANGDPLSLLYDSGIKLATNIYSCASVPRASIKKTTFKYSGTGDLSNLEVTNIMPKEYADEGSKPLWIVENAGIEQRNSNPLWGITSDRYSNEVNTSTSRSERLYIPGYGDAGLRNVFDTSTATVQNLPAIDMLTTGHLQVYSGGISSYVNMDALYSGKLDQVLSQRWQALSANVNTTGTIIDLIWTDLMVNGMLGTRSWLTNQQGLSGSIVVLPSKHGVSYRWAYGVFPLLTLIMCGCLIILGLASAVGAQRGLRTCQNFMRETSVGRVYTYYESPSADDWHEPTKAWVNRAGHIRIRPFGAQSSTASAFDSNIPLMPKESRMEQHNNNFH